MPVCKGTAGDSTVSDSTAPTDHVEGGKRRKGMQTASAEHFPEKRKWSVGNSLLFQWKNTSSFLIMAEVIKKEINSEEYKKHTKTLSL